MQLERKMCAQLRAYAPSRRLLNVENGGGGRPKASRGSLLLRTGEYKPSLDSCELWFVKVIICCSLQSEYIGRLQPHVLYPHP